MLNRRSTLSIVAALIFGISTTAISAATCPTVSEVNYPVRPYSEYNDTQGPFLDKVWFDGTPGGCSGGQGVLCTPTTSGPEICAQPTANPGACDYWKLHLGQDLNANTGDDCNNSVYAIAAGEVVDIQTEDVGTFGLYLLIKHQEPGGNTFYSFYAHLSSITSDLQVGSCVGEGVVIGKIGSTGLSNGCHLHFEIRRLPVTTPTQAGKGYAHHYCSDTLDRYADPESFIRDYGSANPIPPAAATNPEPQDGDIFPELDLCTDDNGTAITTDDITSPCLQWERSEGTEFQEVFFNGSYRGRTRLDCFPLLQSTAPGDHTWQVTSFNGWDFNDSPVWSFTIANVCSAAATKNRPPIGYGATTCESAVPTVTTQSASGVTQSSATLNMAVDPNGATTFVWFDWGTSTALGQETTPHRDMGRGTSTISTGITLSGLACDKTYHFRARANNSIGDATPGQILSFKTSACGGGGEPGTVQLVEDPSFEEGDGGWWVSDDDGDFYIDDRFNTPRSGNFYAYLTNFNGTAGDSLSGGFISPEITIPNSATDADLRFYYRIETQETTTTSVRDKVEVYLVRNGDDLTKLTTISNLDAATSYRSRSVDLSSSFYGDTVQIFFAGSTDGNRPTKFRIDDVTLEVDMPAGGPPSVSTEEADQVTSSSARLNMMVDPNGSGTEIWFDLEPGDASPSDDTEHIDIGAGSGSRSASISVFGLECGTKYYFRAHAENSHDRANGSVEDFTTNACSGGPPNADTDPAKDITKTSATLSADVDPNGLPTQAWFAWGDDADLGLETQHVSVGSGTSNVDFLQTLNGLTCGTTYYFENHAQNSAGHDDGVTLSFTTEACDPGLSVVTVTATDATATESPMTTGTFSIQRTGSTALDLPVSYEILGTATMGSDHTLGEGSVTIPAGASSRILTVFPSDDFYVEDDETVVLALQPGSAYSVGSPASAAVTIVSDDGKDPTIFEDDMENGPRWNYQNTWARTQSSAHSPTYSWTDSPAGSYTNNSNSHIAVGGLDFTNRQSVHLSFWHRHQFTDSGDVGNIWVRADDGGFAWQVVRTFSGTSTGWTPVTVDLSALAGMTQVVIAFQVVTNGVGTGDGWYIDDVAIFEPTPTALDFHTVTPCRVMDTRQGVGPLYPGTVPPWTFAVAGLCGIPQTARAVSLNATAVASTSAGYITLFPADQAQPPTSTVTFGAGQVRANNAVLGLSADGRLGAVFGGSGQVNLVVDVTGYFAESDQGTITRYLTQNASGQVGKDIWTTSHYSYTPVQSTPGGGLDDHRLLVGGWGDSYYSLIEFDLSGLPLHAQTARIELFPAPQPGGAAGMTALYIDRITEFWDWRTQGTGSDRERLWWADRPDAVQWRSGTIPAPTLGQWYSIDITDLYNAWQVGTYPNYGVQLRPVSTNNMWAVFYSANHTDSSLRPRLVIEP